MKNWLLAIICIVTTQTSFAKELKVDQKTQSSVNFMDQFSSLVAPVCSGCSWEVRSACKDFTSTYANEDLCNSIRSNPEVTRGCYYNSSTYSIEAECLRLQIPPHISQGCKAYTSTYENENICMQFRVSPNDAWGCKQYTSTYSQEAQCLRECGARY